ncbi:MAG: NADH-quinone oxidoreductase subunit J [Bacteroidales bacterium]|nr:NADH-quinone oxidoreductase subunit J [Candidatus Equimonas faecalis]
MESFEIMFIVLTAIIALGSIATVFTKSVVRAVAYLLLVLLGTAGLYFLMGYTFLGSVQTMVYAGGVIVLFVFAVLLTSAKEDKLSENTLIKNIGAAVISLVGLGIFGTLICLHGFTAEALTSPDETIMPMTAIGKHMLSTGHSGYLLPFEAVSVLLLACIVGGLVIARKR